MQAISSSQSSPLVQNIPNLLEYAPLRVQKNGHTGLSSSSIRNYTGFLNTWLRFEQAEKTTYGFDALDKKTIERYKKWLLGDCQYSINHARRLLSLLKTLGLDAQKNDHPTHPYVISFSALVYPSAIKSSIPCHLPKCNRSLIRQYPYRWPAPKNG